MSLLGVALAIISYFIVGLVWYSQALFGPAFHSLAKVKAEKRSLKTVVGSFINAFVISMIMSYIFAALHISNVVEGISMAVTLCVGFVFPPLYAQVLWAKMPFKLFCIQGGSMLVFMGIAGVWLALF